MGSLRRRLMLMLAVLRKLFTISGLDGFSFYAKNPELKSLVQQGKCEQRNLPQGYTELEYIDNNGEAWLDLGMPVGSADIVTFDMKWNDALGVPFFGAYNDGGSYTSQSFVGTYITIAEAAGFYANSTQVIGRTTKPTTRAMYKWNGISAKPTLDGVDAGTTAPPYSDFTPSVNAYLFTRNQGGAAGSVDDITLYGFKVERNGAVIINLIPAKRDSDNVVGMYDTVRGQFLTNAGTGSFTGGSAITPSPDRSMDLWTNNGVLRFGKPIAVDSTRISAYIDQSGYWRYSEDSYSVAIPVTVGQKYKIYFTSAGQANTIDGNQNVILRYGFRSNNSPDMSSTELTTPLTQLARTTPQDLPSVELKADQAYLIIQTGAAVSPTLWNSGYIRVQEQVVYADGTPEVLTVCGKNLLNSTPIKTGYYIDASGVEQAATTDPEMFLIRQASVKPSTQYTLSYTGNSTDYTQRWHAYDRDGNWLSQITYNIPSSAGERVTATFTTPSNCYYVRQSGRTQEDYQIELGSIATAYEPYTAQTATVPTLLAVGDYKDSAELISGLLTHKVGVKVLDGTEDWGTTSGAFYYIDAGIDKDVDFPCFCTHYIGASPRLTISQQPDKSCKAGFRSNPDDLPRFYIKDSTFGSDTTAFKQWLADQYAAGTPMIVVYPLETETTERLTPTQIPLTDGITNITVDAEVDDVEITAEVEASSFVDLTN